MTQPISVGPANSHPARQSRSACAMAASLALAFAVASIAPMAAATQSTNDPQPMVVIVPDGPPPARITSSLPTKPEILGIRIESNGALITGPMNARRTYIPLDRILIPPAMRGHWAKDQAGCLAPQYWDDSSGQSAAKDNFLVTDQAIIAKQKLTAVQIFVPPPPSITLAMLQSGKPMMLPARRHQNATEILTIFTLPDGQKIYGIMRLSPSGDSIQLQSHGSNESAIRCSS
ncbi:hypothetical protein [Sphingopyxis yananensis]|uniref:hypothetical protein n=1 Tax=Sphingopyxis yananensis TaxID=2886687 RepID=UPI001D10A09B|nr:hypothetical protein [Sphingopyxis yananensis]MCC2602963.1 hypothetical protein [Sphingopyxis yananensis]